MTVCANTLIEITKIVVQAFPGTTVNGLRWKIGLGKVNLNFTKVVLHVGTNDSNHPAEQIVQDLDRLVKLVLQKTVAVVQYLLLSRT